MTDMTEAQIEMWRAICLSHWASDETGKWLSHEENARQANLLCDLALKSQLWREAVENLLGQIEQGATYHEIAINSPSAQEAIKHAKFLLFGASDE